VYRGKGKAGKEGTALNEGQAGVMANDGGNGMEVSAAEVSMYWRACMVVVPWSIYRLI